MMSFSTLCTHNFFLIFKNYVSVTTQKVVLLFCSSEIYLEILDVCVLLCN